MKNMNGKPEIKPVISASRRTDIPAFYSEWFFKRLQEGFALVKNPMNPGQIRRVSLKRGDVGCFVFWTKNPEPMLPELWLLDGHPFYFQYTLNPYDGRLEPLVPDIPDAVSAFRRLSEMIGPERVIWRYDPIILNDELNTDWHVKQFGELAESLHGYTGKCILSFVDYYKKIDKCFTKNRIERPEEVEKRELAYRFAEAAEVYGLKLETCSEEIDLSDLGIGHAHCVDPSLIGQLTGSSFKPVKDRNQRAACGCYPSVDIGAYNTCMHGCTYCYANYSRDSVKRNNTEYDKDSPLLCSKITNCVQHFTD